MQAFSSRDHLYQIALQQTHNTVAGIKQYKLGFGTYH